MGKNNAKLTPIDIYTWFETLIKPTLGKSVKGNGYQILDTEYSIPAKDARLCQKIAVKAVKEYQR